MPAVDETLRREEDAYKELNDDEKGVMNVGTVYCGGLQALRQTASNGQVKGSVRQFVLYVFDSALITHLVKTKARTNEKDSCLRQPINSRTRRSKKATVELMQHSSRRYNLRSHSCAVAPKQGTSNTNPDCTTTSDTRCCMSDLYSHIPSIMIHF